MAHRPVVVPVNSLPFFTGTVGGAVKQHFAETVLPLLDRFGETEHQISEFVDIAHVVGGGDKTGLAAAALHVDAEGMGIAAGKGSPVLGRAVRQPRRKWDRYRTINSAPASFAIFPISAA